MLPVIQYISQGNSYLDHLESIQECLDGGIRCIQLRVKKGSFEPDYLELIGEVKKRCREVGALFIINDHVGLVRAFDVDGVHLGQGDLSYAEARRILGPDKIIGRTANTKEQLRYELEQGCDYIGLGPYRHTHTKTHLAPILGIGGLLDAMMDVNQRYPQLPVYAVGGIELADLAEIRSAGLTGVAVSGALFKTKQTRLWVDTAAKIFRHE